MNKELEFAWGQCFMQSVEKMQEAWSHMCDRSKAQGRDAFEAMINEVRMVAESDRKRHEQEAKEAKDNDVSKEVLFKQLFDLYYEHGDQRFIATKNNLKRMNVLCTLELIDYEGGYSSLTTKGILVVINNKTDLML